MTGTDRAPHLILASGSRVRARILEDAGLSFGIDPADVDEPAIEADCRIGGMETPEVAETLAVAKATLVSARHPGKWVIGADQMLDLDGASLRKPADRSAAAETLRRLSGREHRLFGAVVIVRDGEEIWRHVSTAHLVMRPLSEAAIADYLDRAGDSVLTSVGAYQLEGLGAQLFADIDGDYFSILGLPLLSLLDTLRRLHIPAPGLLA